MALSYRRTAIVYRSSLDYLLHTQKMDMAYPQIGWLEALQNDFGHGKRSIDQ